MCDSLPCRATPSSDPCLHTPRSPWQEFKRSSSRSGSAAPERSGVLRILGEGEFAALESALSARADLLPPKPGNKSDSTTRKATIRARVLRSRPRNATQTSLGHSPRWLALPPPSRRHLSQSPRSDSGKRLEAGPQSVSAVQCHGGRSHRINCPSRSLTFHAPSSQGGLSQAVTRRRPKLLSRWKLWRMKRAA